MIAVTRYSSGRGKNRGIGMRNLPHASCTLASAVCLRAASRGLAVHRSLRPHEVPISECAFCRSDQRPTDEYSLRSTQGFIHAEHGDATKLGPGSARLYVHRQAVWLLCVIDKPRIGHGSIGWGRHRRPRAPGAYEFSRRNPHTTSEITASQALEV